MKRVGVVTVARSDYGIYRPLLNALRDDPSIELCVFAGGMHLAPEFGMTVDAIEADGFPVTERVEMLLSSDSGLGTALSTGMGVCGFARAYARHRPELLVVLGDRFEMFSAAAAALPMRIPLLHLHGGELTEGATDDSFRHAITKFSHLHCVATEEFRRRVLQLGEEPWRVTVTGALALDTARSFAPPDAKALEALGCGGLRDPFLLVTFHPATLSSQDAEAQITEVLAALDGLRPTLVFTAPNADAGGRLIRSRIDGFCRSHPNARLVENLGQRAYFHLMSRASAMLGNSSSGIIEAPSFQLPVVNIGDRQRGRLRAANVVDAACERAAIGRAIETATSSRFREGLRGLPNPYGDGSAAAKILSLIKETPLDDRLIQKRFKDIPVPAEAR